ncbi:hypothetical protein [uncultured Gilvimarinus sp.]|uniref:hypothetical protein n=1 Tax=uncultured Gilvimarinus sp. TaxID=1689143 RepID=UPI0030EF1E5F
MAKIAELDDQVWGDWVKSRPEVVQVMCESHPPDRLYAMGHGQLVTVQSYEETGTMTVEVHQDQSPLFFPRKVFGVKPEDLTECDLPEGWE